jgi:hypothetical protein
MSSFCEHAIVFLLLIDALIFRIFQTFLDSLEIPISLS